MVDLSKDELKDRLQEATEVIEVLCSELEVAHRYLEGKYEALKILQGKKSEATVKALEKVQMKKSQQSWEQKYNRILSENKALTDSLEERESETQQLRAEHSACSRQCLELLSMLSVKEQRAYQGTKPQYSPERDAADLELDAQRLRREEALMVADAFRIAFEQQLRKRSDHFLLRAEGNAQHSKAEGKSQQESLNEREPEAERTAALQDVEDLLETLYRLLDLLNDKEEALAHQRKVSLMLAHSAEELQRQLLLDSHCRKPEPAENHSQSQQTSKTKTILYKHWNTQRTRTSLSKPQNRQRTRTSLCKPQNRQRTRTSLSKPQSLREKHSNKQSLVLLLQKKPELKSMLVSCSNCSFSIAPQEGAH
ncbi:hypothetical protein F7725_013382 [Dissostichus mawsoni]|uniref:Uncharacterized protein n=1 Tax=Dissostichus mawsoni TaxID=36200 RepID=A0A7J5YQC8_DISMA|nr:hypothetical protein F7725_013382 [Dissostichus mawsoni]